MTIEAKIIADSISPQGIRLTTFQLRYPRFIHAELMTHRMFSRNASSSRAIPVERMIEDLQRDPAMPVFWGANEKGMQANKEVDPNLHGHLESDWLLARDMMIERAKALMAHGLHKQIANRILEPWAHINVVLTATSFENFYALRCHKDAQPEIKLLAEMMRKEMADAFPTKLQPGQWHLPYIRQEDRDRSELNIEPKGNHYLLDALKRVSVARCARVSYLTHDGRQTTMDEDLALYERLVGGMPLHASPAEHQATPDTMDGPNDIEPRPRWNKGYLHGNLFGWIQFRKTLPGEFTPG